MKRCKVNAKYFLFAVVFLIGAYLRFAGITWGIPTVELPFAPLHPDEVWAMSVLQEVSVETGDFNPESGHREGTAAYFLWSVTAYGLKAMGIIDVTPHQGQPYDSNYSKVLLAGRIVVIVFDLLSAILIFLTVQNITNSFSSAILAFLVFLITPFEVIYCHYMRTHVLSNFFIALTSYLSFLLYTKEQKKYYLAIGFSVGLGFATRYPTIAIIVIPIGVYCCKEDLLNSMFTRNFAKLFRSRHLWACGLFGIGFAVGTFIGLPFIFLDFNSAKPHILVQASYIAPGEFQFSGLLNLSRIWTYVSYIIPYGTLPGLWILYYTSVLYLLFCPKVYRYFAPILFFVALYLYSMGKGYFPSAAFIRTIIPLFPAFAICVGLAYWEISEHLRLKQSFGHLMRAAIFVIVLLSGMYDFAYVNAMLQDPRLQLTKFIQNDWMSNTVRVGIFKHPLNYFVVKPVLASSSSPIVSFVEQESFCDKSKTVDYLVLNALEVNENSLLKSNQRALRESGQFIHVKDFTPHLEFAGIDFDFKKNPHDLSYPIPSIDLWRPVNH